MTNLTLNKQATEIFNALISKVNGNGYVKIDNTNGVFMPLSIDLLQTNVDFAGARANIYALAHNYEQNGDLVPDPDMTFAAVETGQIYPLTIQNYFGYKEAIFVKNGDWVVNKRELKDQVSFANMWLKNIKDQQGIKPAKTAKNTPGEPLPPATEKAPAEVTETSPQPEPEPQPEPAKSDFVKDHIIFATMPKIEPAPAPVIKFKKGEKVYLDGDFTAVFRVDNSKISENNEVLYSLTGPGGVNVYNVNESNLNEITHNFQPGDLVTTLFFSEFIVTKRKQKNPYYNKKGTVAKVEKNYIWVNLEINKKETICAGFYPCNLFLLQSATAPAPVIEPAPALVTETAPAPVNEPAPALVNCEHDFDFYDITAPAPVNEPAPAKVKRAKRQKRSIKKIVSTFVNDNFDDLLNISEIYFRWPVSVSFA